jgi:hypothetical protein
MKKTALALIIISVLSLSAAGTSVVIVAKANPIVENTFNEPPIISIQSPKNNETFTRRDVLLAFTLTKPGGELSSDVWIDDESVWVQYNWTDLRNKVVYVNVALDGKTYHSVQVNSQLTSPFTSSLNLTDLEDGNHSVQLHAFCDGVVLEMHGLWERPISYNASSDIINFTVDATPPSILVSPIESRGYSDHEVPLNFTLSEPAARITYSLDEQQNVTIAGNTTLPGLSTGVHHITLYAWDTAGNAGASETITFTIAESFPTTLVIGSAIAVATVVGLGLLVYLKKRQRNKSP